MEQEGVGDKAVRLKEGAGLLWVCQPAASHHHPGEQGETKLM